MLIDTLKLYTLNYPKLRLGRDCDGGYVIYDLPNGYTHLLSGGAGGDISFEEAFIEKYDTACTLFDPDGVPENTDLTKINFIRGKIGPLERSQECNAFVKNFDDYFLKMDIEGDEIDFFESLSLSDLWRIKQIVVEFHLPLRPDSWSVLRKLTRTHVLGHIHANNSAAIAYIVDGINIPQYFECTYVRRDMIDECIRNDIPLPTHLDKPNVPHLPEIELTEFPFVHTRSLNKYHEPIRDHQ